MLELIKNYVLVTKPAIVVGNVITAAGGFFLASRGRPDLGVLVSTLTGLSLVIASGCVFNNYIDRNMDRKMARTQNRVLPRGLLSPKAAVLYGSLIGVVGAVLLLSATSLFCAAIVLAGFTIYVGVYSVYLKRRSSCSTLIGSLAGAAPPLAGYCAVSNCFDMGALILLSIFSLWQMPHSYAIAIFRSTDYAAAAIPVMPVKRGTQAAKKRILSYMVAFVVATLMLTICGYTGYVYLVVAVASGLFWLYLAWAGYKNRDQGAWAKKVFVSSIFIIIALSVMMGFDTKGPETSQRFLASAQQPASVYGVGFISGATAAAPVMLEERFSRSKQEIGLPGRTLTALRRLSVSKTPE